MLDGLSMAAAWTKELAAEADVLRGALGRPPALAIVLVGSRLDSQLYVQRKLAACAKVRTFLLSQVQGTEMPTAALTRVARSRRSE